MMFLKEMLPDAYGVASGEIIPSEGPSPSPQTDLIIYDRLHFPILGRSELVQQVPYEAVYAVIECKSIVDSSGLRDAATKFADIRRLKRCPAGRLRKGMTRGPVFVLFGYSLGTSEANCTRFLVKTFRRKRDAMVVALGTGCGFWLSDAREPVWFPGRHPTSPRLATLAFFLATLLHNLKTTDLGSPSMLRIVI